MKRAKKTAQSRVRVPPAVGALEGERLDLQSIVDAIAKDALLDILRGRKSTGHYTVLADPIKNPQYEDEVDGRMLFLSPVQCRILHATDSRVIEYHTLQLDVAVSVENGYGRCDDITLTHFVPNSDGSVTIAFKFDDPEFDAKCFFGKDCCKAGYEQDTKLLKWKGPSGYCQGLFCRENHNYYADHKSSPKLLHCIIHQGPVPNPPPICN